MISKNNNFISLKLNSSLYDKKSVIEAFAELKKEADAELDEGEYFLVKIKKNADAEKCGYEFLNYVLKLMKNKGIV